MLKGLNFIKGQQDPVALEDSEYPTWLWGVLTEGEAQGAAGADAGEGDLFCTHDNLTYSTPGFDADFSLSKIQETETTRSQGPTETTDGEPRGYGAKGPSARTDG